MHTGVGTGKGARGACAPPHFSEWGGGQRYVCAHPLSDPEFRPRHRAYWYLWRHFDVACITVMGPSDVPPPHFVHVPTPLMQVICVIENWPLDHFSRGSEFYMTPANLHTPREKYRVTQIVNTSESMMQCLSVIQGLFHSRVNVKETANFVINGFVMHYISQTWFDCINVILYRCIT